HWGRGHVAGMAEDRSNARAAHMCSSHRVLRPVDLGRPRAHRGDYPLEAGAVRCRDGRDCRAPSEMALPAVNWHRCLADGKAGYRQWNRWVASGTHLQELDAWREYGACVSTHSVDLLLSEPLGKRKVSARKVGPCKDGVCKVGVAEVGVGEVGASEIGAGE